MTHTEQAVYAIAWRRYTDANEAARVAYDRQEEARR